MLRQGPSGSIIGTTLKHRYRVLSSISSGAMGAVFRAADADSGQEVALKQLLDAGHAHRFEAEARLLSSLSHPRVVRVLDYFTQDSGQYLVMELAAGIDLGELLRRRGRPGLPVEEALGYVTEASEALHYVHSQQIVHRDVKPQNLIVCDRGIVLVDFGVARAIDEEELSGTVGVGTPRFMAPEVFAQGTISARTDVFGLAATLWTLIAGRPPHYAETTPLSELASGVSPQLERTIAAGLDLAPERRYPSVAAFAAALGAEVPEESGRSLAHAIDSRNAPASLMKAIVRAAAGVFGASASSICLLDDVAGELVYHSAWGAGADEIVGVRMPVSTGIAGHVVQLGTGEAVPECRADPRFASAVAEGSGYVPHSLLAVPLMRDGVAIGALSLLDRRDGRPYRAEDVELGLLFAELAVSALDALPDLGSTTGPGSLPGLTIG